MPATYRADQFAPLPAEAAATWATFLEWPNRRYFPSVVGLVKEELRVDYARLRLPYQRDFEQPAGVVHGGAIATLIDTVVVPAIGAAYPEFRPMFTIDMNVRYLSAVSVTAVLVPASGGFSTACHSPRRLIRTSWWLAIRSNDSHTPPRAWIVPSPSIARYVMGV